MTRVGETVCIDMEKERFKPVVLRFNPSLAELEPGGLGEVIVDLVAQEGK